MLSLSSVRSVKVSPHVQLHPLRDAPKCFMRYGGVLRRALFTDSWLDFTHKG